MTRRPVIWHAAVACVLLWLCAVVLGLAPRAALAKDEERKAPLPMILSFLVQEGSTKAWDAIADHPQGTDIPFSLTGTLPADLARREHLAYRIVVRIPVGLDYQDGSAGVALVHMDGSADDVTAAFAMAYDDAVLSASTDDLRASLSGATESDRLMLHYRARFNSSTLMGYDKGNCCWAHLEYADVGYAPARTASVVPVAALTAGLPALMGVPASASNDLGATTMHSSVEIPSTVYTYELRVKKQDADTGEPLAGASFALRNEEGLWYVRGSDWSKGQEQATVVTTDAQGVASFPCIDSEHYELVELKAPKGYDLAPVTDVYVESDVPTGRSATYLDARSSAAVSTATDAAKGVVEVVVADRRQEEDIQVGPKDPEDPESQASGDVQPGGATDDASGPDSGGGPESGTSPARTSQSPAEWLSRQALSLTGDTSLSALPFLMLAVLALLCAVAVRRHAGARNVHKQSAADSDGPGRSAPGSVATRTAPGQDASCFAPGRDAGHVAPGQDASCFAPGSDTGSPAPGQDAPAHPSGGTRNAPRHLLSDTPADTTGRKEDEA